MRFLKLVLALFVSQLACVTLATPSSAAPAGWACYSTYNQNCVSQFGYTGQSTWNYPVDAWGNNCTNYVALRLSRNGAPNPGNLGNAIDWDNNAAAKGFPVNQTPAVGSVAQWNTDQYGHVAYVDWVSGDGNEIAVSESSYHLNQSIPSSSGRRVLTRGSSSWPSTFIHIKDVPQLRGSFDSATAPAPGQLRVTGWAFDEDARTSPINIHVYVGGPAGDGNAQGFDIGPANVYRPDVGNAYPGVGNNHGFDRTIDVARFGSQPVYVYAINVPGTPGGNQLIATKTVGIPNPNPFGSFDEVTTPAPGFVRVRGWTADPSAPTTALAVHVYANSKYVASIPANGSRPDVGKAFPGYGDNHGFDATIPVSAGTLRVCTFGINVGVGNNNTELGCRSIVVAADTTAPQTAITSGPTAVQPDPAVTFAFTSSETPSTFECQLDGAAWAACTSPTTRTVSPGDHSFAVRARDAAGNVDATPAVQTFRVAAEPTVVPTPPGSVTATVTAIRKRSRMKVDLGPDSAAHDYAFRVQRRTDGKWRTVKKSTTRGTGDVRVLDLRRGRYRIVVPAQHGLTGTTQQVRLRR